MRTSATTRTGRRRIHPLLGIDFLRLPLVHVLPKGIRRSRSYGLLHHRRKTLFARVQLMLRVILPPRAPITRRPLLCR